MKAVKIEKKIVGYEVVSRKPEEKTGTPGQESKARENSADVIMMQPLLKRPTELEGSTYRIRTPLSEHALYVTINDIMVNGKRRPFEIFINSKNMENFAWIVALTRILSAVFRHGGDATFLVEELRSVFDPRGGYFKPGGKYMPSLVAEIGECIENHLMKIGIIKPPEVSRELADKREKAQSSGILGAEQCPKCGQLAVARLDGCDTCLECGYSKCG
ncbi:MAG: TSCPD domain-containing protein [Magnetococcales bacterium]|nr:TSCPD domain-containing protein [Magnetococcales bacterium]MBF0150317.1 TSCPD domain-containing protein [Magnetococcales bacterium]MBF0347788.1 TSCPD domain-containing protein [Magnetococcales bacterium]MBF0629435.1 TSCPD domain-containing protein [Magnetococcales bacterium]